MFVSTDGDRATRARAVGAATAGSTPASLSHLKPVCQAHLHLLRVADAVARLLSRVLAQCHCPLLVMQARWLGPALLLGQVRLLLRQSRP